MDSNKSPARILPGSASGSLQFHRASCRLGRTTMSDPAARPTPSWRECRPLRPVPPMAESAPIGMVAARPDGTVVFANARWREITGIDHPTPIPYEVIAADHPPRRPRTSSPRPTSTSGRRSSSDFEIASRIVRPDGQVRHVLAQGAPILDEDGRVTGFVGITADVTDTGRADRRPAPQRRTVPQPHRPGPAGPHRGRPRRARSSRSTRPTPPWSGRTPEELVGTSALALVHPDDRHTAIEMATGLLEGEAELDRARAATDARRRHVVWVTSATTLERDADGRPP